MIGEDETNHISSTDVDCISLADQMVKTEMNTEFTMLLFCVQI